MSFKIYPEIINVDVRWRDVFLPAAASSFGWELDPEAESARQYRLQLVETTPDRLYSGEFGR